MAVQHIGGSADSHRETHLTSALPKMPVFDSERELVAGEVKSILDLLAEQEMEVDHVAEFSSRDVQTPTTGKYFH